MVKRCQLIEVGKACLGVAAVQVLGQLQHVVGVARLRTVNVVDEVLTSLLAGEMFAARVAAESQRALSRHDVPEVGTGGVVSLVATQFGNALKTDDLRHLRVGMHVVQAVAALHQRRQQPSVRETLGSIQVFLFARHGVCIGQHLVHAAMLRV